LVKAKKAITAKKTNNGNHNSAHQNSGGVTSDQHFAKAEETVIEDEVHINMYNIDKMVSADIAVDIEQFELEFDQVDRESAQPH